MSEHTDSVRTESVHSVPGRDDQARRSMRRVLVSSAAGTTIEWYDFFLFGSAAALVFPHVFFPDTNRTVGTLLSFATYAVAFLARPLGGVLFGRMGDVVGRKGTLVTTLLITGVGTLLMGCLPGYAAIGLAAPILLLLLRVVQGLGLGGEWGGAVTLSAEHADGAAWRTRRGLLASAAQLGVPVGNLLASGALAAMSGLLPEAAFTSWGWRVPFLASGLLVLVGLWTRLKVAESPLFAGAHGAERVPQAPLKQLLATQWRPILLTIGMRIASDVSYYVFAVFALSYLTNQLGLPGGWGLWAVIAGSVLQLVIIPGSASVSDRIGRRGVYMAGAALVAVWAVIAWPLLATGTLAAVLIAIAGGIAAQGVMYGPMAAFVAELYDTEVRCSGASVGYQVAAIFGGAPAPLLATLLVSHFHSTTPVALYVVATAVLAFASAFLARETRHRSLAQDASTNSVPIGTQTAGAR
jgi:MFS family permease